MKITGKQFWRAMIEVRWASSEWNSISSYEKRKAEEAANYLNEQADNYDSPSFSEDKLFSWLRNISKLNQLKTYKFLYLLGNRIHSIDSEIRKEEKKNGLA